MNVITRQFPWESFLGPNHSNLSDGDSRNCIYGKKDHLLYTTTSPDIAEKYVVDVNFPDSLSLLEG